MIGAALTAAGLAAQIFGAVKGGKANKANQRLLDSRKTENEAFYNNNKNQSFLDTNAAKGIFERLRKDIRDRNKAVDNNTAVTGGTAEANIAAKSRNQEQHNDVVSRVAEGATNYQQNQEAIYRGEKNSITNAEMKLNSDKAANAANMASNAAGVVSAAANLPGAEMKTATQSGSIGGITPENRGKLNYIAKTPFRV